MVKILSIILVAFSLSMDAFSLALSYGIMNIKKSKIIATSIIVGTFHFFMPLLGAYFGNKLFTYSALSPKYVVFIVFLSLSVDMLIHFFSNDKPLCNLNIFGIILFAISVSIDSFSVGLGINYIYNNIIAVVSTFAIISALSTFLGFILGKLISSKTGKYSFLIGSLLLFFYSFWVLTK